MKIIPPGDGPQSRFSQTHLEYFRKRDINPETAEKAGWRSVTAEEGGHLLGFHRPLNSAGLDTVYYDDGKEIGHRIRLDDPGLDEKGESKAKCLTAKGGVLPYLSPPDVVDPGVWADLSVPVVIVESPAKALAMIDAGFVAIGLGGVYAGGHDAAHYKSTKEIRVHPLIGKNVELKGRRVILILDAGRAANPRVADAEALNAIAFKSAGADVWVAALPLCADGADQGPDDFLAANGADRMRDVVAEARPAGPLEQVMQLKWLPPDERADAGEALLAEIPFRAAVRRGGKSVQRSVARHLKSISGINKSETKDSMSDFEEALSQKSKGANDTRGNGKKSQSARLVELLESEAELFHDVDGNAYASVQVDGHRETHAVRSSMFRKLLQNRVWSTAEETLSRQVLQDAIGALEAIAQFRGDERAVARRVGRCGDSLYLDLCDGRWRAVEISASGWRIVGTPPLHFVRSPAMLALPDPSPGGSPQDLRQAMNIDGDALTLIMGYLVGMVRTVGSFPILVVTGEQGAAKTTTSKKIRRMVDPNRADLRSPPRNEHDLVIAANHGLVLGFDNLSYLSASLSDAFCRLSTGGGFSTRKLYEDNEEVIFESKRPILLNGIEDFATRPDLLDRAVVIHLPAIPKDQRRPEKQIWQEFEALRPAALGALLDAVSSAIRNEAKVKFEETPRMADFAIWATAAEEGFGLERGDFMRAYVGNQAGANDLALEACVLTAPIRELAARGQWEGTATDLLEELNKLVDEQTRRRRTWPKQASSLSNKLRRIAPNLRATGIDVVLDAKRDEQRRKLISFSTTSDTGCNRPFASLSPSPDVPAPNDPNGPNGQMQRESAWCGKEGEFDDDDVPF